MAPQLFPQSTLVFDSRAQIIENCEFIVSRDDIVQVITSKDPAEKLFKAYAIQSSETREVLLVSEPCESAQKAVESLLTKSSEANHNYITLNGFSRPRDLKTAFLEPHLDDDDDAASVTSGRSESSTAAVSDWGSSDEAMMLKHASLAKAAMGFSKDRQRPSGRPGCRAQEPAVGEPRSKGAARDNAFEPAPPRARGVHKPAPPMPHPSHPAHPAHPGRPGHPGHPSMNGPPAPPPPAMRKMPMPMPPPPHPHPSAMTMIDPHTGRPQNNMNPALPPSQHLACVRGPGISVASPPLPRPQPPSRPSKPPGHNVNDNISGNATGPGNNAPRPLSVFHPSMRTHTVRITVHWLHHGQHRIIAQCQTTRESLQNAAIGDVRMNPGAFTSDSNNNPSSSSSSNKETSKMTLHAHVRQAVFAGESYDMRNFYGQDLARLFHVMAADDSIPTFEVVVEELSRNLDDSDDDDDDYRPRFRASPGLTSNFPFDD
ncbi:hypothetical protein F5Y01DRAFT_313184 [Xylaria sp. FL0043]|nr:hypothetical protein F5Y01DRAFT_313184 [Xylaria sp. FL0043]